MAATADGGKKPAVQQSKRSSNELLRPVNGEQAQSQSIHKHFDLCTILCICLINIMYA